MPLSISCPQCQTAYRVADNLAGKKIRCKNCQAVFPVGSVPLPEPIALPPQLPTNVSAGAPSPIPALPIRQAERPEEPEPRRRPPVAVVLEEDDDPTDVRARPRKGANKAPREVRTAVILLLVVAFLAAAIPLIMLMVATSRGDKPRGTEGWIFLLVVTFFLYALAAAAVAAAILLSGQRSLGRALAWPVGGICLLGIPLYTVLGAFIIRSLLSERMRSYLDRGDENDEEPFRTTGSNRDRNKRTIPLAWILGASAMGVLVLAASGAMLWQMTQDKQPNVARPSLPGNPGAPLNLTDLKQFSPDGTFRVLLPAAAKEKGEKIEGETLRWWGIEEGGRSMGVAFFSVEGGLAGAGPDELETLMNTVQEGSLAANHGTVTKVQKLTLAGGHPGRYLEAVCAPRGEIVKVRMYVVGDRVFQLIAIGLKPWIDSPEIDKFLTSFELTPNGNPGTKALSLTEARKGFQSKLRPSAAVKEPPAQPPPQLFRTVRYDAPGGKFAAYISPDPKDGKKHPAIVWITGGDCNSIDEGCWKEGPPADEQSASAYRKAGIVMMFPSLRGGNDNPGVKHSTGGTLALLVAESSSRFRAVFSFGPAHDVSGYGPEYMPFDATNPREVQLRSPGPWLASIKTPTFVIEGTVQGNLGSLQTMAQSSTNPNVHFLPIRGATHYSTLAPANRLFADKILRDAGPVSNLAITEEEILKRRGGTP